MNILITGGAGYIGSHMVRHAYNKNCNIKIVDNFSTGHKWAVEGFDVFDVDLKDQAALNRIFQENKFDSVIHFAGKSIVGESMTNPQTYYSNNVLGTINLLNSMKKFDVKNLIFSSTAAVYGYPKETLISENHVKNPINVYGRSKLMVENIIKDFCNAHHMSAIVFRYFNAAGADPTSKIGEAHIPETHLIPNIINSILEKQVMNIYGDDFDTKDGTCVRDYIHVNDIARAHYLGLDYICQNPGFHSFNLGNGQGFSILEIIKSCEEVLNIKIPFQILQKRAGDPPSLIANSTKAEDILGWKKKESSIADIINSAYKWHVYYNQQYK